MFCIGQGLKHVSSLCYWISCLIMPIYFSFLWIFSKSLCLFGKSLVTQHNWCPQQNYNRTCHVLFYSSERDTLDRDIMEMRKNNTVLNAALKTKTESLLDLQKEVSLCILCTVQYNWGLNSKSTYTSLKKNFCWVDMVYYCRYHDGCLVIGEETCETIFSSGTLKNLFSCSLTHCQASNITSFTHRYI